MADKKRIMCRSHDGVFMVLPRRGRPPVKCTDDNPCTGHPQFAKIRQTQQRVAKAAGITTVKDDTGQVVALQGPSRVERTASTIKNARRAERANLDPAGDDLDCMNAAELRSYARRIGASTLTKLTEADDLRRGLRKYRIIREGGEVDTPVESDAAETVAIAQNTGPTAEAKAAKERLVALGWDAKGRAWTSDGRCHAEITATRGDEMLVMTWHDNVLIQQDYSLWSPDVPASNQRPAHKLGFDPDETPDRELVQRLAGMKVTWWNKLAGTQETAIMGKDKIRIEHSYTGIGDETPDDRIIHFCDPSSGGFRAFRVGALLKIG